VRAHRGTTSLAAPCFLVRWGGRSLAGYDGPDPPGSTGVLIRACSSGGSPVIAGSSPLYCQVYGLS